MITMTCVRCGEPIGGTYSHTFAGPVHGSELNECPLPPLCGASIPLGVPGFECSLRAEHKRDHFNDRLGVEWR